MKKAKTIFFIAFILASTSVCMAQTETFKIINKETATNINQFKVAIKKANMERYRYRTQNDTLMFDNGLKFVLFSAQSLKEKGQTINLYQYRNPDEIARTTPHYTNPTFQLAKNGYLIARYKPYHKN